jgi:hypothetical protein
MLVFWLVVGLIVIVGLGLTLVGGVGGLALAFGLIVIACAIGIIRWGWKRGVSD